jgi:spore coat protein H
MGIMKPRNLRPVFLVIIALFSATRLYPGTSFSGTVLDAKTNNPIAGVRVSIGFTDTVTYTDANGKFSFENWSHVIEPYAIKTAETIRIKRTWHRSLLDLTTCPSVSKIKVFNSIGRCLYHAEVPKAARLLQLPDFSRGMYIIQFFNGNAAKFALQWNSQTSSLFGKFPMEFGIRRTYAAVSGGRTFIFQNDFYYPRRIEEDRAVSTILMQPDIRSEVFNESKIGRYDFTLTTADSLSMEQNALKENYVPAQFMFNDVAFGKVGIRYKGSSYSLPNCFEDNGARKDKPECVKISFKVKFNEYTDSLRFYNMKKLNLHSESIDPSKMHDIISYGLFREMGIIGPRCAFAKVFLNGAFQGLFCAVEDVDGRFSASRWPDDGDGNVYKEKWPISDSLSYYKDGLVTNDKPQDSADVSKMVRFHQALAGSDNATFKAQVSPFMDFDYWLHYIAVDRVIHNSDGIMTWYDQPNWKSNHNYFIYQPKASDGKLWIIPWDLHVTLLKTDQIVDALGVPDWNVAPPTCAPVTIWGDQKGIPAHCDKLTGLMADVCWEDFVNISEHMLAFSFDVDHIQKKIDNFKTLIDSVVVLDPRVDYKTWVQQVSSLRSDIMILNSGFDDYIHKRNLTNDTNTYLKPFDGVGFLAIDKLNNFEFKPMGNENAWSDFMISKNSSITIKHDTINPLWGKADVVGSFVFNTAPGEGKYLEWGFFYLNFEKPMNLTSLKEVQVNLKSDSNRDFWLFIASPEYAKAGISVQYGWWDPVSPADTRKAYKIQTIGFPSWTTGNPPDILQKVLANATGIGFQAIPHFNASGKLSTAPDSGFLRVDNVQFVF